MTDKQKYDRERYLRNREKTIARARAWALANPEKRREIAGRYNAKRDKEKLMRDHQLRTFGLVIERDSCAICGDRDGGPRGLVVHHRDGCNGNGDQPLNNDPANLVVLCRPCHVRVHSRWGLKEVIEST